MKLLKIGLLGIGAIVCSQSIMVSMAANQKDSKKRRIQEKIEEAAPERRHHGEHYEDELFYGVLQEELVIQALELTACL